MLGLKLNHVNKRGYRWNTYGCFAKIILLEFAWYKNMDKQVQLQASVNTPVCYFAELKQEHGWVNTLCRKLLNVIHALI